MFEAISEEVFARVCNMATAHEIWLELDKIHNGSKKVREEKYQVLKEKLNDFKMLPNEHVEQMYTRLNVLVEDINALEISPLSRSDVMQKILYSLHKPKYNIVTYSSMRRKLTLLRLAMLSGGSGHMRCFSWEKLSLLKPRMILLSRLKVNTSRRRRAKARHLKQA